MNIWRLLARLLAGRRPKLVYSKRQDTAIVLVERARISNVETLLRGPCWVIDGDTIIINNVRIRLAGIDSPELDHPWGKKSKWALVQLCKGQTITARIRPELSHDRVVADCFLPDGRDLSAELVKLGLAVDWPKFSGGKYRHLEPPGTRQRLWRADARQRGKFYVAPPD
ncbi:thermonuclease family protein [Pelagibacterium mangrovi]|uniref:thermonuclease family protein n=1 Tax=Pelagibacterium mangrovi TaxID=3119828 RepID=UPI003F7DE599